MSRGSEEENESVCVLQGTHFTKVLSSNSLCRLIQSLLQCSILNTLYAASANHSGSVDSPFHR